MKPLLANTRFQERRAYLCCPSCRFKTLPSTVITDIFYEVKDWHFTVVPLAL